MSVTPSYPHNYEEKIGFTVVREGVASKCVTGSGRELCQQMLPDSNYEEVLTRLESVEQMSSLMSGDDRLSLDVLVDMESQLKVLESGIGVLTGADLNRVRKCLTGAQMLRRYLGRTVNDKPLYPRLDKLLEKGCDCSVEISMLNRVIDEQGNVRDSASPALAQIRSELSSMAGKVSRVIRNVMNRAVADGIVDADTTPSIRDGRLVIPLAPMNKRKINGIIHDESATGKTIFVEPAEVVEVNNRIRELEIDEHREIMKILGEVTAALRPHRRELAANNEMVAEVDFLCAKTLYAEVVGGVLPQLSAGPELEWYGAVHPFMLEKFANNLQALVRLDISLADNGRLLVISGPNAGGKSVCLKTVGVVQYMLQCGLLPPVSENSHMGIFSRFMLDLGDEQSMENALSTYSSHLQNMKMMLALGNDKTLVLIDELGSGTEPQIGGAIAQAILHRFNETKMWGVITTHYQNIKQFAEDTPGMANGSMLYDRQCMRPLYRLELGTPGSSFALEIARNIGLPSAVIDEAKEIVGSDYIDMDKYLSDIARDRRYWERKRMSIRQKEKKVEETLERYQADAESLRMKRNEILAEAKSEAKKIIETSNASIERAIHDIRRSQADKEVTRKARERMREEQRRAVEQTPEENKELKKAPRRSNKRVELKSKVNTAALKVGDVVKLDGQGVPGTISELSGSKAVVMFGQLKTSVDLKRLQPSNATIKSGAGAASFISVETSNEMRARQLNFKQDIDVRGMRVDEALQAVTYFIDDAIQFNVERVRILHGTGTGALRQAIREYLATVPGVKSARDEHVQFGGAGITVIDLK